MRLARHGCGGKLSYAKKCVKRAGNCKTKNKDKKRSDMIKTYTTACIIGDIIAFKKIGEEKNEQ